MNSLSDPEVNLCSTFGALGKVLDMYVDCDKAVGKNMGQRNLI